MAIGNQRATKMKERNRKVRAELWPEISNDRLWSRHDRTGFTTIPRAMPLLMSIMDEMSKGKPVSHVYLEVWCRAFDEGYATLRHEEMAFCAGFTGERAVRTWKDRLRILDSLGLLSLKPGPSGAEGYALVLNPYLAIADHRKKGTPGLTDARYNTLVTRMAEIGATDIQQDVQQ